MSIKKITSENPYAMVILQSANRLACAKTFVKSDTGVTETSYGFETTWHPQTLQLSGIRSLAKRLTNVAKRNDRIVVYGSLVDEEANPIPRKKYDDPGSPTSLVDAKRHWLALDVDEYEADSSEEFVLNCLPPAFHQVTYWLQKTSSHGIKPGLRCRLWFWLDMAVHNEVLKEFAKTIEGVDPSIYLCIQPIYICAPRFVNMDDPVEGERSYLVEKSADAVTVAKLDLDAIRQQAQARINGQRALTRRTDIVPNLDEIDHVLDKISRQETRGSRHHHALAAAFELYALGAEPHVVAEAATNVIIRGGREPQSNEVANALRAAVQKAEGAGLYTPNTPMTEILGAAEDEDEEDEDDGVFEDDGSDDIGNIGIFSNQNSDHANAQIFLGRFPLGEKQFICDKLSFYQWTGHFWRWTDNDTVRALLGRAAGPLLDSCKRRDCMKAIQDITRIPDLREPMMLDCTEEERSAPPYFVFSNGMVDAEDAVLDPDCLEAPMRDYFNTAALPYAYDPEAEAPRWERCLKQWFPDDVASRRELQKIFGYLLTNDNSYEKFFLFYGPTSRNGKGTVTRVLENLLGHGKCEARTLASLAEKYALAGFEKKNVCLINEANSAIDRKGEQMPLPANVTDIVKTVSGGDRVPVRRMQKEYATETLFIRFLFSCNRIPNFNDPSEAIMSRMHPIFFGTSFRGKEDTNLKNTLTNELPGIFNWAVEGLRMLSEDKGFLATEATKRITEDQSREGNPVKLFVQECLAAATPATSAIEPLSILYGMFTEWCADNSIPCIRTRPSFGKELNAGFPFLIETRPLVDGRRVAHYTGFKVQPNGKSYLANAKVLAL